MPRSLSAVWFGALLIAACEQGTPGVRAQSPRPPLPPAGSADSLLGLFVMASDSLSRFDTREHAYEESAAVVYGVEGAWLLVGMRDGGRTWLPRGIGEFLPLEPLLRERLTHLTDAWDGTLRFAPDAAATPESLPPRDAGDGAYPVRLLGTRVVDGALWLEVEVLDRVCEAGDPQPVAKGWLRAWRDGTPTVWFHSRGC